MDPVQKAVISHTFGVPSPLKKKLFISCNICHLRFNSAVRGSSGNKSRRWLGRERAGDWAFWGLPCGKKGSKGAAGAVFHPWLQKRHSESFIHPSSSLPKVLCPFLP